MGKNTAVFGIYKDTVSLGQGLERLRSAGFRSTDVSVLMPENLGTKDLAHKKETKAPEGAATGGVTGGVIGGALGWLAGIGALAIPGLGPFIAAGPIMGLLAGAGAGGAIGGLVGSLVGMGASALAGIKEGENDADLEVKKRVSDLKQRIDTKAEPMLQSAAARVIRWRWHERGARG